VYQEGKETHVGCKAAMRIALSAVLKAVCSQDKGWGCIADNMLPNPSQLNKSRNAFDRFTRSTNLLVKDVITARGILSASARNFLDNCDICNCIIVADARQSEHVKPASVDLIVTSPPYPNMTDYSTSQRLSYYLLGVDPLDDIRNEIGARRKRFSSTSVLQYITDMKAALETSCTKLKSGGFACFIMPYFDTDKPNNTIRRHAVQECLSYLQSIGMEHVHELTRMLPTRHRQHNQKWATLERECISIYRKL